MPSPSADTSLGTNGSDSIERERICKVYDGYASSEKHRRMWADTPASRFMLEGKRARIATLLREAQFDPRGGMCLDVGAGGGDDCNWITGIGVPGDRIVGMDLLQQSLRRAQESQPWLAVIQGDARHLPFREGVLSLVYQSTMLSSVLEGGLRRGMLAEVGRVLRPGGFFLSYDTRYPNPWNPNTRPLRALELRAAFTGWQLWIRSANGIPHLIRLLAPVSLALCRVVESIPPLRSHLLVLARKPRS